jgi:hypothetical protein
MRQSLVGTTEHRVWADPDGKVHTTNVWTKTQTGSPTGRATLALTANG